MKNNIDNIIISLLLERSEEAFQQIENHYGALCRKIAWNVLHNEQDVEECKNDSYFTLWNRIPPEQPDPLRTYLCRIVRNTALKKYRDAHAKKRWQDDTVCFDELTDCIPAKSDVLQQLETKELTKIIEQFLDSLDQKKRIMFVKRYWFCMSVKDIAAEYSITERNASVTLGRIRKRLRQYLQQEDWL